MPWEIEITASAKRVLDTLPENERDRIVRLLDDLCFNPSLVDFSKLGGRNNEWRIRSGRWRVIVNLISKTGTIRILKILPRKDAYK